MTIRCSHANYSDEKGSFFVAEIVRHLFRIRNLLRSRLVDPKQLKR